MKDRDGNRKRNTSLRRSQHHLGFSHHSSGRSRTSPASRDRALVLCSFFSLVLAPFPASRGCPIPYARCFGVDGGEFMMDTEAFREFKTGLTLLRDNYANKALPHMKRAVDLDKNNPYYMSYLGVVLARSEQKWGEAERLCDTAVRMKRNQAQLYLNLAEVYATAGRRDEAVEALQSGLKYARRDVRLTIAMNRLAERRPPVLTFLERKHPLNRQLGILRHKTLRMFGQE
jgi:tetratricopeptide (TPR) repeat protein